MKSHCHIMYRELVFSHTCTCVCHLGEVFCELESSSHHQVIGEPGEGREAGEAGEGGGGVREDRFTATRSLLRGKVKTASLEVSKNRQKTCMYNHDS